MNGRFATPLFLALVLLGILAWPTSARAFTFSDGSVAVCWTSDGMVSERYHPADDPAAPSGYVGFTHVDAGAGWITDWNGLMLSSLPSDVHDFVFFHECAHAKLRSFDEVKANCLGLIDMRAAGRAGRDIEAKLAAYHKRLGDMGPEYGQGKAFWAKTLACANNAAGSRSGKSSASSPGPNSAAAAP
jgi:hypothetical protein